MRITLDAAMRARDVSRPRDATSDTAPDTAADSAGRNAASSEPGSAGGKATGSARGNAAGKAAKNQRTAADGEKPARPGAGPAVPRHRGDRHADGLSGTASRSGKRRAKGSKRRRRR
jgi:hypothetical protein